MCVGPVPTYCAAIRLTLLQLRIGSPVTIATVNAHTNFVFFLRLFVFQLSWCETDGRTDGHDGDINAAIRTATQQAKTSASSAHVYAAIRRVSEDLRRRQIPVTVSRR